MLVLCADDAQEPPREVEVAGIKVVRVSLRDTAKGNSLNEREAAGAVWAAEHVANELRAGGRVAVGCLAGVNRSAFVAALALVRMGLIPEEAIEEVRLWRGPVVAGDGYRVLRNEDFLAFLRGLVPVAEARP
jgi:predicted protein tyrosine phosphatase